MKLWPADTFVDFDHGLNKVINKIREALSDSAETPRFVETVARRGYRFLAEVKVVNAAPISNAELTTQPQPATGSTDRKHLTSNPARLEDISPSFPWKISVLVLLLL